MMNEAGVFQSEEPNSGSKYATSTGISQPETASGAIQELKSGNGNRIQFQKPTLMRNSIGKRQVIAATKQKEGQIHAKKRIRTRNLLVGAPDLT